MVILLARTLAKALKSKKENQDLQCTIEGICHCFCVFVFHDSIFIFNREFEDALMEPVTQ